MNQRNRISQILVNVGLLLIAAGIIMPLVYVFLKNAMPDDTFHYVFAAGAAATLVGRLFADNHSDDLRLRRLMRLERWSALFFVVAAVMLFIPKQSLRDVLALTLCGGVIQAYASIMINVRIRRLQKKKEEAASEAKTKKK